MCVSCVCVLVAFAFRAFWLRFAFWFRLRVDDSVAVCCVCVFGCVLKRVALWLRFEKRCVCVVRVFVSGAHLRSKHWLVGAGLSDPRASLRSVSDWCREFAIDDSSPICKSSVSHVRNAFGEILRGINRQDVRQYAAGATDGFIVIRHLHDEASMRLRSDLPAAPAAKGLARGRSSKVQNSVVTLHRNVMDEALPVFLELQPLGRKDAATLATALRSVLDSILSPILASPEGRSVRVVHCLVGDGIFTNLAAARLLWSWVHADRAAPCYRLLTFTCSTHAANLVVRTAIVHDGRRQRANAEYPMVANCVRFFKYLMPEYASDFVVQLRDYVESNLHIIDLAPRPEFDQHWAGMQELYGKAILPDRLRKVLNATPGVLEYWCLGRSRGSMTETEYAAFVADVAVELERCCLRTEERPVTTRFWTFECCVQTFFRWKLFQLPAAEVLKTSVKKQRETNQKRISRVRAFLDAPETRFELAVACLCLRLTGLATSITGQKSRITRPGETDSVDRSPLMVRLAQGAVTERVAGELSSILGALHHDAVLAPQLGVVVTRLLITAGHVVLRFKQYTEYPCRAILMSKKWNPDGFHQEILRFLAAREEELDTGYSVVLRKEALASGRPCGSSPGRPCGSSHTNAILHLSSPPVQEELATIAYAIETSTLDVERKHNYDRRTEAPTVTSVAKASRDSFVRQWRTSVRVSGTGSMPVASKAVQRKYRFANAVSVAFEANPDLFPQAVGKLHWESRSVKRQRRMRTGRPSGSTSKLEAVMQEHGDEYRAEARRRRGLARRTQATASPVSWPTSNPAWVQWLDAHEDIWEDAIRAAKAGVRNAVNQRIVPHADVPQKDPRVRLQPRPKDGLPSWADKVADGWHALSLEGWRAVIFAVRTAGRLAAFAPALTVMRCGVH